MTGCVKMVSYLDDVELSDKPIEELIKEDNHEEVAKKLLPVVKEISSNVTTTKDEFLEGISEGIGVVLNKIDDYDPDKYDTKFMSYVYPRIRGQIIDNVVNFEQSDTYIDFKDRDLYSSDRDAKGLESLIRGELMVENNNESEAVDDSIRTLVKKAIRHLRPMHRKIIYMQYWQGKTREEIGNYFGIGKSAVSTRIWRSRKQLRKWFERRGLDDKSLIKD